MTTNTWAGIRREQVGRYLLEDLVVETDNSTMWRAFDPALRRPVGARLLPLTDPRVPALRAAAQEASRVDERQLVRVLDVVESTDQLAIITEWVSGRSWNDLLKNPWDARDAAVVAYEVARALQAAHRAGIAHGWVRPSSVIITDTGEVRLRGLGVDAVLYGVEPPGDARAADCHGVGALLYAGLAGRWPVVDQTKELDHIPTISPYKGAIPAPSQVVAGVPPELDEIVTRCLLCTNPPRGLWPFADISAVCDALGRAIQGVPQEQPHRAQTERVDQGADRLMRNLGIVAVSLLFLVGLVIGGIQYVNSGDEQVAEPATQAAALPGPTPSLPSRQSDPIPSQAAADFVPMGPRALPMFDVSDFDPQGRDGAENPDLVPAAHDGDPETAWTTVEYAYSSMEPKAGTGILIDLGTPRPIREVDLDLLGSGTDVEIRIARERGTDPADYELLMGVVAAKDRINLRAPVPTTTRYVLVWLTNLPFNGSTYQGGIQEVEVRG